VFSFISDLGKVHAFIQDLLPGRAPEDSV